MDDQTTHLQIQAHELKARVKELEKENAVLQQTVVKLGALGDAEKRRLLLKVLKEHPDCYTSIEFEEAFDESAK